MMIVVIGLLGTGETTWNIGVWYRCYEVGHASGARYQCHANGDWHQWLGASGEAANALFCCGR